MCYKFLCLRFIVFCYLLIFLDYLYVLVLLFFFFKYKTAYEMRISDWSSDVCSSDLAMVALSISRQAEYPPTGKPAKTGSRSSRADAVGPDAASASHRQELEANMSRDNAIVMRYDNPDIPSGRDIV